MYPKRSEDLLNGPPQDSEAHGHAMFAMLHQLEQISGQLSVIINQQNEMMSMAYPEMLGPPDDGSGGIPIREAMETVPMDAGVREVLGKMADAAEARTVSYYNSDAAEEQFNEETEAKMREDWDESDEEEDTPPDGPEDEGDEPQEDPGEKTSDILKEEEMTQSAADPVPGDLTTEIDKEPVTRPGLGSGA